MAKANRKNKSNESSLSSHKLDKKKLIPPFLQLPNVDAASSWLHNRLPNMLWAALVINDLERDEALDFFRYVAQLVNNKPELADVTLTGIQNLNPEDARILINHMLNWSQEIPIILRPLGLYPELPASDIWNELLESPIPEEDWNKLSDAVQKTLFHQTQEATDCRWAKILCLISGGKIKFLRAMEEIAKEIIEYPNYGDMKKVRPTIRSMEMSFDHADSTWPNNFWQHNYLSTLCFLEEQNSEKFKTRREDLINELKNTRTFFIGEVREVRNNLITHFFESSDNTQVNSRHETSFGLALYSLTLFAEIMFYNTPSSITGRMVLRSLIEVYISFEYLLKREHEESGIWDDFHEYGTGQTKLIYTKLKEQTQQCNCIELDELNMIATEDKMLEFIPINLGQWGNSNLRKMSEYADVKDIYDLYYSYTSGFVHGTRGAIRETAYQYCLNPLHRYHRVPQLELPLMPSTTLDSVTIVNKILDCLNSAYPDFDSRINLPEHCEPTECEEK